MAAKKPDVFDCLGNKYADALISTCLAANRMQEPFRSAAITALEEITFRFTGRYFYWEQWEPRLVEAGYSLDEAGNLAGPAIDRKDSLTKTRLMRRPEE